MKSYSVQLRRNKDWKLVQIRGDSVSVENKTMENWKELLWALKSVCLENLYV